MRENKNKLIKIMLRKTIQFGLPIMLITALLVTVWGAVLSVKADTAGVTLQTVVQTSFSFGIDSANLDLTDLTPGTPITDKTSILTVTTNNSGGFIIKASRNDNDTTLDLITATSTNITDQTDWDSSASAGDGNAVIQGSLDSSGAVLAFRVKEAGTDSDCVNETWWGADDTEGTAKWSGYPTPTDTIINDTTYESSGAASVISYYIDVAGSQATGTYDGGVTYTATAN